MARAINYDGVVVKPLNTPRGLASRIRETLFNYDNNNAQENQSNLTHFFDKTDELFNQGYVIEFFHPHSNNFATFKSWLTSYQDHFHSNWNKEDVIGRNDPFWMFKNTERTISFSFKVIASGEEEAISNMEQLSTLSQMMYPIYNTNGKDTSDSSISASSIVGSPIVKLKFLNLIKNNKGGDDGGLYGKFDDLQIVHENLEEQGYIVRKGILYPRIILINIVFNVMHTHRLGWNESGESLHPFDFPYKTSSFDEYNSEGASIYGNTEEQINEFDDAASSAILSAYGTKGDYK